MQSFKNVFCVCRRKEPIWWANPLSWTPGAKSEQWSWVCSDLLILSPLFFSVIARLFKEKKNACFSPDRRTGSFELDHAGPGWTAALQPVSHAWSGKTQSLVPQEPGLLSLSLSNAVFLLNRTQNHLKASQVTIITVRNRTVFGKF